jgi:hypothetical protein
VLAATADVADLVHDDEVPWLAADVAAVLVSHGRDRERSTASGRICEAVVPAGAAYWVWLRIQPARCWASCVGVDPVGAGGAVGLVV